MPQTPTDSAHTTPLFHPIEVFLNGNRPYVQGTQMIARAAEHVARTHKTGPVTLRSAAFRSISKNAVMLGPAKAPEGHDAPIGTAGFDAGGAAIELGFYDTDTPARPHDIAEPCRYRLVDGAPHAARHLFEITDMRGLEGVLVAMVQCLKTVHAGLAPDVHDIWFTGLRGAAIAQDSAPAEATLTLTRARMMGKSPNWQSLTTVSLAGSLPRSLTGTGQPPTVMSFAFKSATFQPS